MGGSWCPNCAVADLAEILSPESELDFVRRAKAGDEDAFGVLVRGHYEAVFRLVQSIVRDEHASRDVCQEVWLAVWRNLARFRGDAKFSTWVHPIAVRKAIDHLRRRRRWLDRFRPLSASEFEVPDSADTVAPDDPRRHLEAKERRERFERALASLPPKHRAVIALREINGFSYEEIARQLGLRRGTVMSRLFNARRRLAQKLENRP